MNGLGEFYKAIRQFFLFFKRDQIQVIDLVNDPLFEDLLGRAATPEIHIRNLLPDMIHHVNYGLAKSFHFNVTRFPVVAKIRNLASALLSCVLRRLRTDWQRHYGVAPWLVDRDRFHRGCYRASNFIVLGQTSGRGRMDRTHQRHGAEVKTLMVYPLIKDAAGRLRGTQGG